MALRKCPASATMERNYALDMNKHGLFRRNDGFNCRSRRCVTSSISKRENSNKSAIVSSFTDNNQDWESKHFAENRLHLMLAIRTGATGHWKNTSTFRSIAWRAPIESEIDRDFASISIAASLSAKEKRACDNVIPAAYRGSTIERNATFHRHWC